MSIWSVCFAVEDNLVGLSGRQVMLIETDHRLSGGGPQTELWSKILVAMILKD